MDNQLISILILVIDLVLGVLFCFFGNRWLKVILAIYGFSAGFLLANTLLPILTSFGGTTLLLASLGAGVVGALLFVFLLYFGVFCIGFGGGLLLCLLLVDVLALNILSWYVYIPALVICCLLGALTLNHKRIFIGIFTAFIGASALAQFVDQIVNGIRTHSLMLYDPQATYSAYSSTVYLVALGVLFVAGMIVQLSGKKR
jgi:hypothetical protein